MCAVMKSEGGKHNFGISPVFSTAVWTQSRKRLIHKNSVRSHKATERLIKTPSNQISCSKLSLVSQYACLRGRWGSAGIGYSCETSLQSTWRRGGCILALLQTMSMHVTAQLGMVKMPMEKLINAVKSASGRAPQVWN